MEERKMLRELAAQLDKWADESINGERFSTHQVTPMRNESKKIKDFLARTIVPMRQDPDWRHDAC